MFADSAALFLRRALTDLGKSEALLTAHTRPPHLYVHIDQRPILPTYQARGKRVIRNVGIAQLQVLRQDAQQHAGGVQAEATKSTVLHALAAAYKSPRGTASNYKQFFPPLAADVWNGTRFVIEHTFLVGRNEVRGEVEYRKGTATTDWTPDVPDRPLRYLSYVGVKSCLPDLEAYESHDLTKAVATPRTSDIDARVREAAGGILNCRYTAMASLAISGETGVPERQVRSRTCQAAESRRPSCLPAAQSNTGRAVVPRQWSGSPLRPLFVPHAQPVAHSSTSRVGRCRAPRWIGRQY